MAKPAPTTKKTLTKSAILSAISDIVGPDLSKKHVKEVVEHLVAVGHKELKTSGIVVLPGCAKFTVVRRPAHPCTRFHPGRTLVPPLLAI
jgi:nucleoid DNA-binding protein